MYDKQITDTIPHYKNHKTYLPHIPKDYGKEGKKVFIIGESHYLPNIYNNKINPNDWYNNSEKVYALLSDDAIQWINTRGVIQYYSGPEKLAKGHRIFKNLDNAFSEIVPNSLLFNQTVYFNYFQRPAEEQGKSIRIQKLDAEIALKNLVSLNSILSPDLIIFTSSKAFKSFNSTVSQEIRDLLPKVEAVPHPACAWWNRTSKKYGTKVDGSIATGKDKFIRIIKNE